MTVGELRKTLESHEDGLEVILQKDPEGNSFSNIWGIEEGIMECHPERAKNYNALPGGIVVFLIPD